MNAAIREPQVNARIASDPLLVGPPPVPPLSSADGTLERSREYDLHSADARAPLGIPAVARRLAALVEAATPSEWELYHYDALTEVVVYRGFREGQSFRTHLDHDVGLALLLERAEHADGVPSATSWKRASEALAYARSLGADRLQSVRSRLLAVWRAAAQLALAREDDTGRSALGWLRRYGADLGMTGDEMADCARPPYEP